MKITGFKGAKIAHIIGSNCQLQNPIKIYLQLMVMALLEQTDDVTNRIEVFTKTFLTAPLLTIGNGKLDGESFYL